MQTLNDRQHLRKPMDNPTAVVDQLVAVRFVSRPARNVKDILDRSFATVAPWKFVGKLRTDYTEVCGSSCSTQQTQKPSEDNAAVNGAFLHIVFDHLRRWGAARGMRNMSQASAAFTAHLKSSVQVTT